MSDVLNRLAGGDRRSIGQADAVVADLLADPTDFEMVIEGLTSADPVVRMRAADVAEKVSARRPDLLQPHKARLLAIRAHATQQEVRWHAAQMTPRLALTDAERQQAVASLTRYLEDQSRIVQTCALQALADLAEQDVSLRPLVARLLRERQASGSPAVKSRCRQLLAKLRDGIRA